MSQFEEFKNKFNEFYKNSIYKFIEDFQDNNYIPFELELMEDYDTPEYDSYGNENTYLAKVFYFKEYKIYVKFEGSRQSYMGEEWNTIKEFFPITKTIQTYE